MAPDMSMTFAGVEAIAHGRPDGFGGGAPASAGGVRAYLALMKPTVMSLVIFTAIVGLMLAPGHIHPVIAFTAILCIAAGAGASGAINMWFDRDIDAVMARTRGRPLPMGRLAPADALGFGVALGAGSVAVMALAVNLAAAALLALTILFYVFIYTMWLKRRTPQNIVIGGAAGAFPPLIGWAAVTGGVDLAPLALFAIIFFWTPPHFWALALYRSEDYAQAGVPMMPVVAGPRSTKRQILLYALLLLPIALAPYALGLVGPTYGVGATVLGALFAAGAVRLQFVEGERAAKQLFGYSILYLFVLFGLMLVAGPGVPRL